MVANFKLSKPIEGRYLGTLASSCERAAGTTSKGRPARSSAVPAAIISHPPVQNTAAVVWCMADVAAKKLSAPNAIVPSAMICTSFPISNRRPHFSVVLSAARTDFTDLPVIIAFKGPELPEKTVMERDDNALALTEKARTGNRVVIGLGIECSKDRRLIAGDARHRRCPFRNVGMGRIDGPLNVRKQMIIVTLQRLMITSFAGKIEDQLKRSDNGREQSGQRGKPWAIHPLRDITQRRSAEHDNDEIAPSAPSVEGEPSGRVVKRVTQHVEADEITVHAISYFLGGGGAGCLGPAGPELGLGVLGAGCLGPIPRSSCLVITFFLLVVAERRRGCFRHARRHLSQTTHFLKNAPFSKDFVAPARMMRSSPHARNCANNLKFEAKRKSTHLFFNQSKETRMPTISKAEATRIENAMFDDFIKSGPKTREELLGQGYTAEQVDVCAPKVAKRIREAELA